jgi:hypothetical protein
MPSGVWLEIHSEALRGFVKLGLSFTEAAKKLNSEFGTSYTRNACIGRAQRMGVAGKLKRGRRPKELVANENQARWKLTNTRRKAQRWAAKPWLAQREAQIEARRRSVRKSGSGSWNPASPRPLPHIAINCLASATSPRPSCGRCWRVQVRTQQQWSSHEAPSP